MNREAVARELLKLARSLVATVEMFEEGGQVVVRGPYGEMRDIFPKLKGRGFKFHSPDKSWRIDKSKMTPAKMRNLEKLIPGTEQEEQQREQRDKCEQILSKHDFSPSFEVKTTNKGIWVSGETFPVKSQMKSMGGRWNSSNRSYFFDWSTDCDKLAKFLADAAQKSQKHRTQLEGMLKPFDGDVINFKIKKGTNGFWIVGPTKPLYDVMKEAGGRWDRQQRGMFFHYDVSSHSIKDIYDEAKSLDRELGKQRMQGKQNAKKLDGQSWDFGNVTARDDKGVLIIRTSDRKYRDAVKELEGASWSGSYWEVPYAGLTNNNVNEFLREMERFEEQSKKEYQVEKKGDVVRFTFGSGYYRGVPKEGDVVPNVWQNKNKGPDYLYILDVKRRYVPSDGLSFGVGEERGYLYTVTARKPTEREMEPLLEHEKQQKSKKEALKELKDIAVDVKKRGTFPKKSQRLSGDLVYLNKTGLLYGGGTWFVISPSRVWFVQNNGTDGDDWSRNNVQTGGAGALGWVVPNRDNLGQRIKDLGNIAGLD